MLELTKEITDALEILEIYNTLKTLIICITIYAATKTIITAFITRAKDNRKVEK